MANFSELIKDINAVIKENGRREITGQILQDVLVAMVESINEKKQDPTYGFLLNEYNPYLYEILCTNLDYEYAKAHIGQVPTNALGCTSFKKGSLVGRNLDWKYDNSVEFIVRSAGVVGVAGCIPNFDTTYMQGEWQTKEESKLIPFFLQDGVNTNGVFASVHVVKGAYDHTERSIPAEALREEMPSLMLVRYILDHFTSAREAVEYIRDYVSILSSPTLREQGYDLHWFVADKESSYVLEIIEGEVHIIEKDAMTNFYWYGVTPKEDGTLYSVADVPTHRPTTESGLTLYAQGVERYNLIARGEDDLAKLAFSNAYTKTSDIWFSEFVSEDVVGRLTIDDFPSSFTQTLTQARLEWEHRNRETAKVWHTKHSCVYNLDSLGFSIITQDGDDTISKEPICISMLGVNVEKIINKVKKVVLYEKTIDNVRYLVNEKDEIISFADVLTMVKDQHKDVVVVYQNVEHVPSVVYERIPESETKGVVEFSAIYYMYDMVRTQRVIINEDNDVKVDVVEVEKTDNKVAAIDSPRRPADDVHYPTTKAVKTFVENGLSTKQDADKMQSVLTESDTNYPSSKAVADYVKGREVFERGTGTNSVVQKATSDNPIATGIRAVATGRLTKAEGYYSFVSGIGSSASGYAAHAEGSTTSAKGDNSHAEGASTKALGRNAHAEGNITEANASSSHAEGLRSIANGEFSHAEGNYTTTSNSGEHSEGNYNVSHKASDSYGDAGNTAHSVGIGTSDTNRKNAHEIKQNGDHYIFGVGGYDGTNSGIAKTLQQVINEIVDALETEELVLKSGISETNKKVYDLLTLHPQLSKEVVFLNTLTNTYYKINSWKQENDTFKFTHLRIDNGSDIVVVSATLDANGRVS